MDRYFQFLIVPLCLISGAVFTKIFSNKEEKLEKKDENPIFRLLNLREIVLIQSIHPNYVKQPADALYWRPGRLEQNKKIFEEMKTIANHSGINALTHPATGENIVFKDLFNLLEKSIAYSEDINRQLITEPSEQAEGNTDQKAALRKKLLEK